MRTRLFGCAATMRRVARAAPATREPRSSDDQIVDTPRDERGADDDQRDESDRAGVSEQPSSPAREPFGGRLRSYEDDGDRRSDGGDRGQCKDGEGNDGIQRRHVRLEDL